MATRTVQVVCEYAFSISTMIDIDEEDSIEDVFVRWSDLRLVTDTKKEVSTKIDLADYDVDMKRPLDLVVYDEDGTEIYTDGIPQLSANLLKALRRPN